MLFTVANAKLFPLFVNELPTNQPTNQLKRAKLFTLECKALYTNQLFALYTNQPTSKAIYGCKGKIIYNCEELCYLQPICRLRLA